MAATSSVPVAAARESYGPYYYRPAAPFLAHLIATAGGEQQTREHRRARPEAAARAYAATLRSLATPESYRTDLLLARLAETGLPVLLVWGEDDRLLPLARARLAHRRLPGSRLEVIAGAGHAPQAEQPEAFNDVLERFLAS